jgi:hypothetical protein
MLAFLLAVLTQWAVGQGYVTRVELSTMPLDSCSIEILTPRQAELRAEIAREKELSAKLVWFWDTYAKECYADSTVRRRHKDTAEWQWAGNGPYRFGYMRYDMGCSDKSHWVRRVWHRTPDLPGFMEFLRRNR